MEEKIFHHHDTIIEEELNPAQPAPLFKIHRVNPLLRLPKEKKTGEALEILRREKLYFPYWDAEKINDLHRKTGLSCIKIYKWGWDYDCKVKKKAGGAGSETESVKNMKLFEISSASKKLGDGAGSLSPESGI